jgi:hypothetical protein
MGCVQRFVGTVVCAVLAATGAVACGSDSSQLVARVGSSPITESSLDRWAANEASVRRDVRGEAAQRRAISLLISAQRTIQQAHRLGVGVGSREVAQQTEYLKYVLRSGLTLERMPRQSELTRILASARVGSADQEWLVRVAMLDGRIEQARIAHAASRVTWAQVLAYYRRHMRRFLVPESREVAIVETLPKRPIVQARHEIEAGKDFAAVARRISEDPRARDGHTLHLRSDWPGAPGLMRAIFTAKAHVLVGPLFVARYYLFDVLRITPAHERPLAQARSGIVRELASRAVQTSAAAIEREWRSRTACARALAVPDCGASLGKHV